MEKDNCDCRPGAVPTGKETLHVTEVAIARQKVLGRASIEAIHAARAEGAELDETHELVVAMRSAHRTLTDWRLQRGRLRRRIDNPVPAYGDPTPGTTAWYRRYGYPHISEETLLGRNHI